MSNKEEEQLLNEDKLEQSDKKDKKRKEEKKDKKEKRDKKEKKHNKDKKDKKDKDHKKAAKKADVEHVNSSDAVLMFLHFAVDTRLEHSALFSLCHLPACWIILFGFNVFAAPLVRSLLAQSLGCSFSIKRGVEKLASNFKMVRHF